MKDSAHVLRARLRWVKLYEETGNASFVCRRCGISRPTLRKWWVRYQADGEAGLYSRSHRPHGIKRKVTPPNDRSATSTSSGSGTSASTRPAWVDHPAPAPLRAALLELQQERDAFLSGLREADLPRPLAYTLFNGSTASLPLSALLLHVASHSTYHRGQAASMLRRLGATPPPTDYLIFAAEASAA